MAVKIKSTSGTTKIVPTVAEVGKRYDKQLSDLQSSNNLKMPLAGGNFTGPITIPSKTVEAANSGTAVASEAQVNLLKQSLTTASNKITTVNINNVKQDAVSFKSDPQNQIDQLLISGTPLNSTDTRSDNNTPDWYMTNRGRAAILEFKLTSSIGVNDLLLGDFCQLSTFTPWGDNSGGYPVQIATNNSKIEVQNIFLNNGTPSTVSTYIEPRTAMRTATSDTTWGDWYLLRKENTLLYDIRDKPLSFPKGLKEGIVPGISKYRFLKIWYSYPLYAETHFTEVDVDGNAQQINFLCSKGFILGAYINGKYVNKSCSITYFTWGANIVDTIDANDYNAVWEGNITRIEAMGHCAQITE